jgi:hypothetical protein
MCPTANEWTDSDNEMLWHCKASLPCRVSPASALTKKKTGPTTRHLHGLRFEASPPYVPFAARLMLNQSNQRKNRPNASLVGFPWLGDWSRVGPAAAQDRSPNE